MGGSRAVRGGCGIGRGRMAVRRRGGRWRVERLSDRAVVDQIEGWCM